MSSTPYHPETDELLEEFCSRHHLPLDWNEELSLEDYLERVGPNQSQL